MHGMIPSLDEVGGYILSCRTIHLHVYIMPEYKISRRVCYPCLPWHSGEMDSIHCLLGGRSIGLAHIVEVAVIPRVEVSSDSHHAFSASNLTDTM